MLPWKQTPKRLRKCCSAASWQGPSESAKSLLRSWGTGFGASPATQSSLQNPLGTASVRGARTSQKGWRMFLERTLYQFPFMSHGPSLSAVAQPGVHGHMCVITSVLYTHVHRARWFAKSREVWRFTAVGFPQGSLHPLTLCRLRFCMSFAIGPTSPF